MEWEGVGTRGMSVDFILLTGGTAPDVLSYKGCKAWPPEFRSNKLASFQDIWVTSGRIVLVGNNRVLKISVGRNIDVALIGQNASIVVPIREVGLEFSGEFARKSMEGIEDNWVRDRRGTEFVGEGRVNKVDKEYIREKGNCFVVCVRSRNMVRSLRQSIGCREIFAGDGFKIEIKL